MSETSNSPLLANLRSVRVVRPGGYTVLTDIDWTLHAGEQWAIVGAMGSGKSTLLQALLGKLPLAAGHIDWPLLARLRQAGRMCEWVSDITAQVTFQEESRLFSYRGHYYQERFDFADDDNGLTLLRFLKTASAKDDSQVLQLAETFGLTHVLEQPFITLSNGQVRRSRIARALLAQPEVLVLDEPFMGLDTVGREELSGQLGRWIDQGRHVVLSCREDGIPDWVTHRLELDQGRIVGRHRHTAQRTTSTLQPPRRFSSNFEQESVANPVIEFENVTVQYGSRAILRNVSWRVEAGERWAVLGPNGAGKSTLLSLICGDHPQAYSNTIRLFGRQRGTGESIWDVKRAIGMVSPELHLYFTMPLTAAETVATGFFDVLTYRAITAEQTVHLRELLELLGLTPLADRPFSTLSTGEQRLVLIARALVKSPPLLILDEPFQGLDSRGVSMLRHWLDTRITDEQTLIFVSHYESEIPECVTKCLQLRQGIAKAWQSAASPA